MRYYPFFRQSGAMDCGPSCLQMIAKYYEKSYSSQYLKEKAQTGKEGVSLLGLSEAAENIGFRSRAVKLKSETLLTECLLPCILHWNQDHFVVLYQVKKNRLLIADPGAGLFESVERRLFIFLAGK